MGRAERMSRLRGRAWSEVVKNWMEGEGAQLQERSKTFAVLTPCLLAK